MFRRKRCPQCGEGPAGRAELIAGRGMHCERPWGRLPAGCDTADGHRAVITPCLGPASPLSAPLPGRPRAALGVLALEQGRSASPAPPGFSPTSSLGSRETSVRRVPAPRRSLLTSLLLATSLPPEQAPRPPPFTWASSNYLPLTLLGSLHEVPGAWGSCHPLPSPSSQPRLAGEGAQQMAGSPPCFLGCPARTC